MNKTKSKPENTPQQKAGGNCPSAPCSTLDVANQMIRQQEYLLNRQNELMQAVTRRNVELVAATNQCHRENHKLRKELEGYKRGRMWTMIASMLPTMEMRLRDE